jgi:hypothetical protein
MQLRAFSHQAIPLEERRGSRSTLLFCSAKLFTD